MWIKRRQRFKIECLTCITPQLQSRCHSEQSGATKFKGICKKSFLAFKSKFVGAFLDKGKQYTAREVCARMEIGSKEAPYNIVLL